MIQKTINNSNFKEAIDLALVVFCQQFKRDIPLPKHIEGNGDVEGNANKYYDSYGTACDCKYSDNEAYNKAVQKYNAINGTVNGILNARNNGNISSNISTLTKHGAAVFSDIAALNNWTSFDDVPEVDRLTLCCELVKRQIVAFNQKAEKIEESIL